MKKNLVISALILLVLCLTGCSSVYDAAISGTVKDRSASNSSSTSSNVGIIGDAMVYAYDSESDWNKAYQNWVDDGKGEFSDNSVPSAKTSTADGSFSIATLRWKTNSPAYGKDADSKTIYLLVFHKDYGLTKVNGRTVQSDKSNNFGVVLLDKVTTSKSLVISFKDKDDNSTTATGSDSTITSTDGFSYRYKYNDGYSDITGTVSSITNGKSTLTVKYKDTIDVPTVTIYDIQSGSDWTYAGSEKVEMKYDPASKSFENTSLYFTNDWKSVAVTVKLKDGSSSTQDTSVTDSIDFTWSYNNGDSDTIKTDTVTVTSGSAVINVKYKKSYDESGNLKPCTLTLAGFTASEGAKDNWYWTESETSGKIQTENESLEVKLDGSKDSVSYNVYFKKKVLVVPTTGFTGYLVDDIGTGTGYGKSTDNGVSVAIYNASSTKLGNSVYTTADTRNTTGDAVIYNGYFSSLAAGQRIELEYENDDYTSKDVELTLKYTKRGGAETAVTNKITVNSATDSFDLSVIEY